MISLAQWIHGVEWVWLIWLASIAVVLTMTGKALQRWRRPRWVELAHGEEGLSYTLSYVLVFPIYFLFVCVVFEASWLLVAKVGTMYAAHAGARSQVVWSSAQTEQKGLAIKRTNQAVWTAMTPFITGDPRWISVPGQALLQSVEYVAAYKAHFSSGDPYADAPNETLGARYHCAASRTTWDVQVDPDPAHPNGDVTVTVTYLAPLHIPGAARVLNAGSGTLNEYRIVSTATLPNEAPANRSRTLGIDYQSR